MRKLSTNDLNKLVNVKKRLEQKSANNKHIHKLREVLIPPHPGFGIFNTKTIEVCFECGFIK